MDIPQIARRLGLTSTAGKLARLPLSLIPSNFEMPVLTGANKGMRWIRGSGPHACWIGYYESDHVEELRHLVRQGSVAYDVGANAGFYTLALSRIVGDAGRVFAFEPEARNVDRLRRHLAMNGITNTTIVQAAVSDKSELVAFEADPGASNGSIASAGRYMVPSISLDQFVRMGNPAPHFIKMDIEGAEGVALRGAEIIIRERRPPICLATHSRDLFSTCREFLAGIGYHFKYFGDGPGGGDLSDFFALPTL
jgi:FkbM family methyltransferase